MSSSSIISSAVSAGSNIGSSIASYYQQMMINEHQKQLADEEYQKNINMAIAQARYNRPINQMKRLEEAGLNPNLIYGKGAGATQHTGQLPKYNAPELKSTAHPPQFQDSIAMYFDNQQKEENINHTKAVIEGQKIENVNKAVETKLKSTRLDRDQFKLGVDQELRNVTIGAKETQLQQQQAALANLRQQNKNLKADNRIKGLQAKAISNQITLDEFEIMLNKYGLTRQDSKLMRMIIKNYKDATPPEWKTPIKLEKYKSKKEKRKGYTGGMR